MKQRVITGFFITLAVVGIFLLRMLSNYIFDAAFTVIIIIAANEVARVFTRSGNANNSILISIYPILSYATIFIGVYKNINIKYLLLINLALIIALMIVEILICLIFNKQIKKTIKEENVDYTKYSIKRVLLTGFLMLYPSFILSPLLMLNHIGDFAYLNAGIFKLDIALFFLLLLILTTVATDTFAYLVGSSLKGPKLCPLISPNKTISGAIGGLLGGLVVGFGVYAIFCALGLSMSLIPPYLIVIYTVLASVISQAGDIFASLIKRKARTKDYSSVFPGHGGFMDRLDGISFNTIFSLVFFMLFMI